MNCSTPGLPVHDQLPEFTQTHIHRVSDAIQPSHPLLSPSPPAPNPSQHQSLCQWVNSLHQVAKYWSFSFSIIPCKEIPGLIFRMDWLGLLAVQGTLKSLLQHHSSKASILGCSAFFTVQLSHPYMTTGKTIALTRWTFVGKVMSLLLNMPSRLFITFLPRSKRLCCSHHLQWFWSPQNKVWHCFHCFPIYFPWSNASGGDGVLVELFQIVEDDAVKVLHSICQQIWKTQQWPQDWKRSVFIPIPEKGNAKECSDYCTIALISYASKIMLKILQTRLQQYVNREIPDVQAGFRKGRETRDQIANICWIIEKAREFQKNIYCCFIDYTKAFDYVDHNKLWKVLKEMGIPDHLTCLLRNLYAGQEATVGTGTTDFFQIGKGVRQGCILSPW